MKEDCNLSKRMKTKDERNLEDLISVLPIEILVSIVSLLPLENAGATSILSRPWKNVWKYTLNLNFDSVRVLVGNENLPPRPHQSELLYSLSSRYVNCVNQVLDLHEAHSIQRFRANFYLDCWFAPFIDQWIHFAMEKGVQILELDFCHQWFSYAEPYTITKTLLSLGSKFEHESLNNPFTLSRGACGFSAGFSTLKVLLLKSVVVTGEVLESLLSKCPLLERLSLRAVEKLKYIRGVSPSIKHLVIIWCMGLERVEICDTKIVSFFYHGMFRIALNLSNVPLLTEVAMLKQESCPDFVSCTVAQLSCCLSRIEILRLDIRQADCSGNNVLPLLANLKHFELVNIPDYDSSIYHVTSFLKASPCLQSLKLKWRPFWPRRHASLRRTETIHKERKVDRCPHQNLKVVEMIGYISFTCWENYVIFFIENLVSLEKIVIDPIDWCAISDGVPQSTEELEEARDYIIRLGEKVPSTIKLGAYSSFECLLIQDSRKLCYYLYAI